MRETISADAGVGARRRLGLVPARARAAVPTLAEAFCATASALLLILAFPDFDVWPLAWVALAPLLYPIARSPRAAPSFVSGWLTGTIFFYVSCHWLTYPMIRYAGFPAPLAYVLLVPVAAAGGIFFGLFALCLARLCARLGAAALFLAPALWAACEWARLGAIGQLWNAVGYSQAFRPELIQAARFGGVYAVGFLVLSVNTAIAYAVLKRSVRSALVSLAAVMLVALAVFAANLSPAPGTAREASAVVVAVQPNVIPDFERSESEYDALRRRHFKLSDEALRELDEGGAVRNDVPRVVVWPESPMNFSYGRDSRFREDGHAVRGEHSRRVASLQLA